MSYVSYRGAKNINGKRQYGPRHTSYGANWQNGFKGAYREIKSKNNNWDFVIIEWMHNDFSSYTDYYLAFIDKEGIFGKKNGVVLIKDKESKGSLSRASVLRYGAYLDSNGLTTPIKRVMEKKNTKEYGVPDNWHPFGL